MASSSPESVDTAFTKYLTLAANGLLLQSFGSVCPSVSRNSPVLNGKGRLRESTHSRGIVVMLSPAQWCSSVQP